MNKISAAQRAAEAGALIATLAIAGQARWSLDRVGPVLDLPASDFLYVERAQLLLVPTVAKLSDRITIVGRAMREARSDALIVRAPDGGSDKVELAFGQWTLRENRWHAPMTLWRRPEQPVWLVPTPYLLGVCAECFLLEDARLLPRRAPWTTQHEQRTGQATAQSWVRRIVGRC